MLIRTLPSSDDVPFDSEQGQRLLEESMALSTSVDAIRTKLGAKDGGHGVSGCVGGRSVQSHFYRLIVEEHRFEIGLEAPSPNDAECPEESPRPTDDNDIIRRDAKRGIAVWVMGDEGADPALTKKIFDAVFTQADH